MPRTSKSTLTYTLAKHPDLLIAVAGRKDSEAARKKAILEIQRRMELDEEEEDAIPLNSFENGLSTEDLVLVSFPAPENNQEELPLKSATQLLEQFVSLKREFKEKQAAALPYLELINACFSSDPLTEEQLQKAQQKNLLTLIEELINAKVKVDTNLSEAKAAKELFEEALTEAFSEPDNKAALCFVQETEGQKTSKAHDTNGGAKTAVTV